MARYSTAICPPAAIVEQVKVLKDELYSKIGWFGSRNAEAHITFNVFSANESELQAWTEHIAAFVKDCTSFEITLNRVDYFKGSHALYLAPDESALVFLNNLMKRFYSGLPHAGANSGNPHMSIARDLSPAHLEKALSLFGNRTFNIRFTVDNLAIRAFNPNRRQYDLYRRFYFRDTS